MSRTDHAARDACCYGAIAAWLVVSWWLVADLVPLSEDWTVLAATSNFSGFTSCFDRAHTPPRPLQHALFWAMNEWGLTASTMRLLGFAMHGATIAVLVSLARRAGLAPHGVRLAAWLYALFPSVRALGWICGISGPGHVLFELAALLAYARSAPGSRVAALVVPSAMTVAVAWHQSSLLTPLVLVAWRLWVAPVAPDDHLLRRAARSLREPAVFAAFALAALAVWWMQPVQVPHGGLRQTEAIAANLARAALAWLPEPARVAVTESLRMPGGSRALGLAALGAIAASGAALWWRGGSLWRFALAVSALDLGVTAAKAGFSLRYALLAAAVTALPCARAAGTSRGARLAVYGLALSLAIDSARDLRQFVRAGTDAAALLARAVAIRAELPTAQTLWIVDPPLQHGAEGDIPVWNWGLREALARRGVSHVRAITSARSVTFGSDVERVPATTVTSLIADATAAVLLCEADGKLRYLPPGRVPDPPRHR